MKATKNINIYLIDKKPIKVIDVVQYDTGIQLVFTVKDFPIPSDATATLYIEKPSGNFVYQKDNITVSGNTITVDLENQALTEHGRIPYQVTVTSGSDTFTTFTGLMLVERSLKDAGAVESRTVIRAFDEVTIDEIAEFQANARIIADAVIATIPDEYIELSAKVNESANAIKGKLSGAIVTADDVSPVEHLMNVKVHGKNIVSFGTITFSKNKSYLLDNPIPAGTYTISAYITSNDTDGIYTAVSINHKNEVMKYVALKRNERVSATFTVEKPITNIDFCAAYNYSQGEGDSATWADIQLEEGNIATEYTPYIDPSTVTITKHGKNLAYGGTSHTYSSKGLTISRVENSSELIFNGTTEETNSYLATKSVTLMPGTYTVSVYGLNTLSSNLDRCYVYDTLNSKVLANSIMANMPKSFTLDSVTQARIEIVFAEGSSYSNKTIRLQMEYGSEATEYEECREPTSYIPTSDGEVPGVDSISPNMTILTDTEGVVVECEYNKDTNKVIKKITDALGITI